MQDVRAMVADILTVFDANQKVAYQSKLVIFVATIKVAAIDAVLGMKAINNIFIVHDDRLR